MPKFEKKTEQLEIVTTVFKLHLQNNDSNFALHNTK